MSDVIAMTMIISQVWFAAAVASPSEKSKMLGLQIGLTWCVMTLILDAIRIVMAP